MNKYQILPVVLLLFVSCKMATNSDKQYGDADAGRSYRLHLNPDNGSQYHYDISNETEIKFEIKDTKVDNINKTDVGVFYNISKDSAGNFVYAMQYDKIKIHSKSSETETEIDADNATYTTNPLEKMLGILKSANIVATVNQAGDVKSVTGYKELSAKVLANLPGGDANARNTVQSQWEQFVEKGVVKANLEQLFKIFPDSVVHVGDKWKLTSRQNEQLGLSVKASFTLKEIDDTIATISSSGDITSDSSTTNLMGQVVSASLKGKQEGEYEMNIKTGMLSKSKISGHVEGTIQMMGREIPLNVETSTNVSGKKVN